MRIYQPASIARLSEILLRALRLTIGIDPNRVVFCGNEEKQFLHSLLFAAETGDRFPNSFFKAIAKTDETREDTRFRVLSSWVRRLRERRRNTRILHSRSTLVHYHACFRGGPDVVSNLTEQFVVFPPPQLGLRKQFAENLVDSGASADTAEQLSLYFPRSHLEAYNLLARAPLLNVRPRRVVSSIYGLMDDPLLSRLLVRSGAELTYVQHGGSYGLIPPTEYEIEKTGCDRFLHWGLGDINVYPTAWKRQARNGRGARCLPFVCSSDLTAERFEHTKAVLASLRGTSSVELTFVLHPRGEATETLSRTMGVQVGVGEVSPERFPLMVFDSIHHTTVFEAIVRGVPFLVCETDDIAPPHARGQEFVALLRKAGVLISLDRVRAEVVRSLQNLDLAWRQKRESGFQQAEALVLGNPSLEEYVSTLEASRNAG